MVVFTIQSKAKTACQKLLQPLGGPPSTLSHESNVIQGVQALPKTELVVQGGVFESAQIPPTHVEVILLHVGEETAKLNISFALINKLSVPTTFMKLPDKDSGLTESKPSSCLAFQIESLLTLRVCFVVHAIYTFSILSEERIFMCLPWKLPCTHVHCGSFRCGGGCQGVREDRSMGSGWCWSCGELCSMLRQ